MTEDASVTAALMPVIDVTLPLVATGADGLFRQGIENVLLVALRHPSDPIFHDYGGSSAEVFARDRCALTLSHLTLHL